MYLYFLYRHTYETLFLQEGDGATVIRGVIFSGGSQNFPSAILQILIAIKVKKL